MAKLDLVGIIVKDMDASLAFYRAVGLEIPDGEGPHRECMVQGGLRIAWDTVELMKSLDPDWQPPVGHRMGLAFLCEGPADVDATYQRLVAAGYKGYKPPWDAFWGQRYAQIQDPDGNHVDLFAAL